ncbi:hypothetical protein HY375_00010 [Candidatus Berkelbacteria bacterium]|nr:hypothetical protein [Candidatus Berkelbacteria bacterium]
MEEQVGAFVFIDRNQEALKARAGRRMAVLILSIMALVVGLAVLTAEQPARLFVPTLGVWFEWEGHARVDEKQNLIRLRLPADERLQIGMLAAVGDPVMVTIGNTSFAATPTEPIACRRAQEVTLQRLYPVADQEALVKSLPKVTTRGWLALPDQPLTQTVFQRRPIDFEWLAAKKLAGLIVFTQTNQLYCRTPNLPDGMLDMNDWPPWASLPLELNDGSERMERRLLLFKARDDGEPTSLTALTFVDAKGQTCFGMKEFRISAGPGHVTVLVERFGEGANLSDYKVDLLYPRPRQ